MVLFIPKKAIYAGALAAVLVLKDLIEPPGDLEVDAALRPKRKTEPPSKKTCSEDSKKSLLYSLQADPYVWQQQKLQL